MTGEMGWSKKKSPWEMRGFDRKWQGGKPFHYGLYLYDCVGIPIIPHLFLESGFHVCVESYVQFSVII